jgi:hypothetical protein
VAWKDGANCATAGDFTLLCCSVEKATALGSICCSKITNDIMEILMVAVL